MALETINFKAQYVNLIINPIVATILTGLTDINKKNYAKTTIG